MAAHNLVQNEMFCALWLVMVEDEIKNNPPLDWWA
jgi:hypothetical protein